MCVVDSGGVGDLCCGCGAGGDRGAAVGGSTLHSFVIDCLYASYGND